MRTVREIMNTDVVAVKPEMTLHDLARVFAEHDISGAPVVDDSGTVVGVVSASDVVRFAAEGVDVNLRTSREGLVPPGDWVGEGEMEAAIETSLDRFLGSDLDDYLVERIMTTANFHVDPDTTVQEVAQFLVKGRIHRALVMDDGELAGIVTSVDVLRAVAEA